MSILLSNSNIYGPSLIGPSGSVGGFFTIAGGSQVFGITNLHVFSGSCQVGDGVHRMGSEEIIGSVKYWFELDKTQLNYFDLVLFEIKTDRVVPHWNVPVSGFADAQHVPSVQLITEDGQVRTGVNQGIKPGPFVLGIGGKFYKFTNLIQIHSTRPGAAFSNPGDSGSLILADNRMVGILVGGDPNHRDISYAMPFIDSVRGMGILDTVALRQYGNSGG